MYKSVHFWTVNSKGFNMTLTQKLQDRKNDLTKAQREFAKNPSATNWQRVTSRMESYQLTFTEVQEDRIYRGLVVA
jgi:cephalosporin-C deacetylase-like acetyl esterase